MMTDDKRLLQKSAGRQILFKSRFVTSEGVLIPEETFGFNSLLVWEKRASPNCQRERFPDIWQSEPGN